MSSVVGWSERYARAWVGADEDAVAEWFTEDAVYRRIAIANATDRLARTSADRG